jgi:cytochrome c biogenesis protein CcdA
LEYILLEKDMSEQKDDELAVLKNLSAQYRARAFRLVLGILLIFGVPAATAVWLGKILDADQGRQWQITLLIIAFVLSWSILVVLWKSIDQNMKANDARIKAVLDKRKEEGLLKPISGGKST